MTPTQFAALVTLTSVRSTQALRAAELVLVDDVPSSVAADSAGISRQQLSNVLTRLRQVRELAMTVCAPGEAGAGLK